MNRLPIYLIASACALLTSCAQLSHQTEANEPHASVRVAPKSELARAGIASIDGMAVKYGTTYRLRPGAHTVEVEYKRTGVIQGPRLSYGMQTAPTSNVHVDADGRMAMNDNDPFNMHRTQPISISAEDRRYTKRSVPFRVEAGKRYELSPDPINPCRQLGR